jgi:chaperonin GroEL
MESARDAATRTASEAGDGTTTATILAAEIVKELQIYCQSHPNMSPQKVTRLLEKTFKDVIEPTLKKLAIKPKFETTRGKKLLHSVAKISANGDEALADAVLECFEVVGDEGNVTLAELSGPSEYKVEKLEGYPVGIGYEESCYKFAGAFVNDRGNQRLYLEKPVFILYHGAINDIQTLMGATGLIWSDWQTQNGPSNVILVATKFSENVLASLAAGMGEQTALNIFPLVAPISALPNSQLHFLQDLEAVTGATIFDPVENPLPPPHVIKKGQNPADPEQGFDMDHFGFGIEFFEAHRYNSTVVCSEGEDTTLIEERVEDLKTQAKNSESLLDKQLLEERIAKLTGGIAKLIVVGLSAGEIREKKDRAEDAVRAVQGAIKHGCLPGGGWALLKIASLLETDHADADGILEGVLGPALIAPFDRLLLNAGLTQVECDATFEQVYASATGSSAKEAVVYNALTAEFVNAFKDGLLDSAPAVIEAIRSSISIASYLGTLGACVVFPRDEQLERDEARAVESYNRNANVEEANERP